MLSCGALVAVVERAGQVLAAVAGLLVTQECCTLRVRRWPCQSAVVVFMVLASRIRAAVVAVTQFFGPLRSSQFRVAVVAELLVLKAAARAVDQQAQMGRARIPVLVVRK